MGTTYVFLIQNSPILLARNLRNIACGRLICLTHPSLWRLLAMLLLRTEPNTLKKASAAQSQTSSHCYSIWWCTIYGTFCNRLRVFNFFFLFQKARRLDVPWRCHVSYITQGVVFWPLTRQVWNCFAFCLFRLQKICALLSHWSHAVVKLDTLPLLFLLLKHVRNLWRNRV